ncbi:FAD-binding oxidoreductase [Sphingomonas sp. SUN039]|uniref:NAD(P)/FAD-dependent oxidoreductase n=1 Tax=Sphingomonas sp. SUN039 TaxID=2937787 RepID=UPI002164C49E|nr:FAD-binding oxidoreductase [Sphingomonas sp. SUN039]UVO53354.1 FAD-binding oxidoreductase [Sphingomonas sp. SUN039]
MKFDVAIVGAGIAGASVAAELAPHCRVVLLEAEDMPGYHSTGRSAAFWHETLGGPLIQPLTTASRVALEAGGFLKSRLSLNVATTEDLPLLDRLEASFAGTGVRLTRLDHAGVAALVPRATAILAGGVVEEDCADIDVAGLHAQMLAGFKRAGGILKTDFRVDRIARDGDGWLVAAATESVRADVVVNAAGSWADGVAAMAGIAPVGIAPKRRTIAQVRVDGDDVPPHGPLTIDIAGGYYFKPEGPNRVWVCPHDETPVEAGDAAPEELDVAIAIDRFETVTSWRVVAVERKWAGLRSFAPDRLPVYGFAPDAPGFFWCAGQGGVGIQTAPAAGALCAHLILGDRVELPEGVDPQSFASDRFA